MIPLNLTIQIKRTKKIIKLLKGLLKRINKPKTPQKSALKPVIIPRAEHTISRTQISSNALKVLYRLNNAGFGAYLVGGCVRDLLLGRRPKDFDIATNATPEEVRRLFRNCRLIGKRFRLAHIVFGKEVIEVATFRTHHQNAEEHHAKKSQHGMIMRDNVFGDIEDDVWRRDFSVNALYYNIADFSLVDYANGMHDIKNRLLRIIGDPQIRFQEDPIRLLRAARFMGKLNLQPSPETEHALTTLSHLLLQVSPARLFQEVLKFFQEGATVATFTLLRKYNMLEPLFPQMTNCLQHPETEKSIKVVLQAQSQQLAIPRNLTAAVREICLLQHFFNYRYGAKPYRSLEHPRFRAAYDLLLLRAKAGEEAILELAQWWTDFHDGDMEKRGKLVKEANKSSRSKHRRGKRSRHSRSS